MKQFLSFMLLGYLVVSAAPATAQEATIDDVSKEASRLEAELGKYRDTAPEAGDALFALAELYHANGRSFGLVRSAHRFTAAHPTDKRHAQVMLRLMDGLESLSRNKEFSVQARQFLTRYPKAPQCPDIEARLAYTLEKMAEKERSANAYRDRWNRQPNPAGRHFGVKAVKLYGEAGGKSIEAGATLAEEIFDKMPKDEFAKHMGLRSYWEWRRISQWAKANVVGKKLVASRLLKDAEGRREILRTMAENYGYLGQYSNAVEQLKQVRAIRDDQWAHYYQIQRMYDSATPAAQMEPVVKQYLNNFKTREDRYERIGLLALAWNRDKDPARALALFKTLLPVMPATHSVASYVVSLSGTEPAQVKAAEQALLAAIPQCEQRNPKQVWALRYYLGFTVYRDRMKDNAKAKAMLRQFIEKSPTNDGNVWNAISWLLSNAESDAEFRGDVTRILKARRSWAHWRNLGSYPGSWLKSARKAAKKDVPLQNRVAYLEAELEKSNRDPVISLISTIRRGPYDARDAAIRDELLKPANFNTLMPEVKRYVLWDHGYYHQHYSPRDKRPKAATYYARLIQLFPDEFNYRYRYLQAATDYSPPEVAREAALSVLQKPPVSNNGDLWRRLMIAAERNEDQALARQVLAYRKKSWDKFGLDHYYATALGDSLVRLKMEAEAEAVWKASAKPGVNVNDARDCASRLFAKIEDPQQKIQFAQLFFAADTDFHGIFASWIADTQLRMGNLDGFEKTLRDSRKRTLDRAFRASGADAWSLHYMLHNYRTSHADYRVDKEKENTPENALRVAQVIRDMDLDWPSAQAQLILLEAEPAGQRKPMERALAWQRVTRAIYPDSHRWDQLMPFAQQAVTRQDYSIAATLLTGMLENLTLITDSRRQQGRAMIGQCYTRLGTVGLTIDENSPIAPLLQAALYLRLGDERLTLETYLANKALFDQHRDEVPVDLIVFVCDNLISAGGQDNHEKVEDILRNWIIKNSESKSVDEKTKAEIQFLLAKNFFGARRYDVARSEYQTVINRYPETSFATEAEFGIGETFMAQKVYDQAEQVFEKLAGSRDAEIIVRAEFLRGVLSHRRGDNDEARDIFRTVLERVPNIELANQALFNLAEVYGDEERYMDQLQLLMTVGRLGRVSKRQHAPGLPLSIVVQDSDLGISRGHNRIPVIVRTEPGGDEEQIFLTSGGAGKGLFRADVDTELGPVSKGDNVLQVTGHDTIKCDYPEQFKSEFKSVPLSDVEIRIASDAGFEVASSKIIDIEEESFSERLEREERERELADSRQSSQRPTNQIKPGNPIYLRVKDGDRDLSDAADTIVAKLVADSGDQVQVTLTETEPHSGVFEGSAKSGELPAGALATDTAIDHSPLMAIDQDPKTYWLSEPDGVTPKLLTVDMKDLHTISRARFNMPDANENRPVRAALQASYDGEFWYTVESYPQVAEAPPLVEKYGAMRYQLYSGSVSSMTTWLHVQNLVGKGEPIAQGEVADGQLRWQRSEDDEDGPKQFAVVWFGKFVQRKPGAVRFQVQGYRTGLAVNGRLEMPVGNGGQTVDVWLDAGLHDLTVFASGTNGTQEVSARRVRADLNRQNTALAPFLTSDFDLNEAADLVAAEAAKAAEPAIPSVAPIIVDLEKAKLSKKTEQFGVQTQGETKHLGYWQAPGDVATWQVEAAPGVYDVWLNYATQSGGSQFRIEFGDQLIAGTVPATGNWATFNERRFGTVAVNHGGATTLTVRAVEVANGGLMNLRGVELRPASGSRLILSETAWDFRFDPIDVRYTRFVVNEYLGEAVAVSHVEISGDGTVPVIPTEADVLALSQNSVLEIAGGDVVTASYTDEVTQTNAGGSRLLTGKLQATYFNGSVAPIAYDFARMNSGAVATVRKRLKRVDPGDRVVVEITDYDRDVTVTRDKVAFEVSVNGGEPIELIATETEENTGLFTKEVDTSAVKDGEKLVVKAGDRINIRYLDEQNTFPGHSVPRDTVVYVTRPTEGRIRVLQSRALPRPADSTAPPRFVFDSPADDVDTTNVAFEAPLTVEVIDPDAAKDSLSEVTVTVTTSDGATADVRCLISGAYTAVPNQDAAEWALEEGRFIGQVIMQLGSKSSPGVVPITAEMPRNLIGGGKLDVDEEEGMSALDRGLVARVLNLTGKDRLQAVYKDERRPDEKVVDLSSFGRLISNGVLASVDRDYEKPIEKLHVGEKLFLVVADADRDSSDERDTITVEITSKLGEKEEVPLVETLAHSGVFTGSLTLKSNPEPKPENLDVANPILESYFGDQLTVKYIDPAASSEDGTLELTTELPVVIGTDGLVSAFSKTFKNEKLAVETKFHIAESYFELFKSHKSLGRSEEEKRDLASGRRVLREVIEDFPDPKYQPRILYLLGQFAQELGSTDEAAGAYEQIVRQFPDHPLAADAQYKLAQAHEEAGDFDEALEAYVTLAATYPKSPLIANVMIRISDHFYKAEEFIVAAQVGKKFLEKFEGHQYASRMAFRVGQCYFKSKEYTTAAAAWDEFAKDFPDDELSSSALFWAGEAYRTANNNREAFRRYNRCRWDYPATDDAKYARGRLALPEMLQQFEAEANSVENEN